MYPFLFKPMSCADQFLEDTCVQLALKFPALPELVVVVVQACPVRPECVEAVFGDIVQHRCSAAGYFPALPQTINLALAICLSLTEHEVIVVCLASCTDEVAGG
jgi:hypothetical protein